MTLSTMKLDEPRSGSSAPVKRRSLLEIAWSRKHLIGLGIVVGLVVGVAYYALATPLYQSRAQVLIVKKRPDSFTGIDTRNLSIEDFVATHKTLIESPTIIEGAVQRRNLGSLESFQGQEDVPELILRSLVVTRNRSAGTNNNVLDLSFRATRPADAAAVLNAVIESYNDYLEVTYRSISDDTLKLITKARDVLEQDLKKQDAAYRTFRQGAPVLLSRAKEGVGPAQERLSSIDAKRSALLVRKAEIQGYLQAIDASTKAGTSQEALLAMLSDWSAKLDGDAHGASDRTALNTQLFTLLQDEQKLLEARGENHIEVKMLRKRIELAREYLASPAAAWRQASAKDPAKNAAKPPVEMFRDYFSQQLRHAEISEKLLAALYQEQFDAARELANYEVEDEKMRRDIAVTEKLLDSIIKKLEDANMVKNVGGYDAKTIAPVTAGKKVHPSLSVVLPAALLLGGIFGFGLAYFAEMRDKTFRNVEEIGAGLGLPLVGHIPRLQTPAADKPSANTTLAPILYAYHQPNSVEAEAFRSVRTALYFSIHGKGHKVVQVTSANSGDGKTTTAANLAISIAQSGKKVLLVDADMRTPGIHKLFGVSAAEGLSSVIVEEREPKEVIRDAPIPGLSILPSGPVPPNPAELLTSPRFKELLDHLRDQFDFVVIDSPPLLAVTDPGIVAHHVDGVFLTVRFSKNGRPDAERAKDALLKLQANIIGVVFNDSEAQSQTSDYRYGSSERYHQAGAGAEVPSQTAAKS